MNFRYACFIVLLLFTAGCEKDQYKYKEFINNTEVVYAGLAENFVARSGRLRVQLEWTKSIDPKVVSYIIYWNNNRDSATIQASAIQAEGVYKYLVPGLPEYTQAFKIITVNDRGTGPLVRTLTVYEFLDLSITRH
ncbi:DUF4998 domain-containing protein [Niabella hibiscisoli]|uniref:DUF4998 domain-containing protein n=1 Tax=Niabella hibiscisoli TaxID=1825928 RepID=UPI001F0FD382|nr:DUF4998 domain-containing protein [Niabella hibiscisoli]MCH5719183.1 DUF4998 domain-containing protein [Niabella hibiscisoli]